MYKIYFGERYLLIADKGINKSAKVFPFKSIDNLPEFVSNFDEALTEKSVTITTENPEAVFSKIIEHFTFIEAAGGVVKNTNAEFLMIYRYHKWDLPKGKREKGELIEQCALREVEEECGISGHQIVKPLSSTFHTYHDKNRLCIKQTFWFEMYYHGTTVCIPQLEEDISQAIWVKKYELPDLLINTYPSVIDIMKSVV